MTYMNHRVSSSHSFPLSFGGFAAIVLFVFAAAARVSLPASEPRIVGWGNDQYGQASAPLDVRDVTAVASGKYHNLALKEDGTVVAWGDNSQGQTDVPEDLEGVVAVAAGVNHSLALKEDGTVVVWGANWNGERDIPEGLEGVMAIAAGGHHSLALKDDGTVVAWGGSEFGQTNVPEELEDVVAVAAGYYSSLALKDDGTVVAWGNAYVPEELEDVVVVAIAAGDGHNLALKDDGTVVAWGDNWYGETDVPEDLEDVVAIAAGHVHSLAVKSDGTVVAWGRNNSGETDVPEDLEDVVTVAAGLSHSLAVKNDGTVIAWGDNLYGQTNIPPSLEDVVAVAAGGWHSLALKDNGTVVAWGDNWNGQTDVPGDLEGVVAIAAGHGHNLALKDDGTVVAWGLNGSGQADVPEGLQNVVSIAAGGYHSLAAKADGTVVVWGNNDYGQWNLPIGLEDVVAVAAGMEHCLALKANGAVVGWGRNDTGQTDVPHNLEDVAAITAGAYHSLALKGDGTVVAWGDSYYTNPGFVSSLTGVVAVAAGFTHSIALKDDGTVVAWGDNWEGLTDVPPDLEGVTAIAGGMFHSLALAGGDNPANNKPALTDADFPFSGGQLLIEGGEGPYVVTVVAGELPEGLEISSTGLVSGAFTDGPYSFTLRVTDSLGRYTQRVFSGLRLSSFAAPPGIVAWWPADSTVADIIGGARLDTIGSDRDNSVPVNPPDYTSGKVGRAFHFNGVDQSLETLMYEEYDEEGELQILGAEVLNHLPLTIEGWVKPEMRTGTVNTFLATNVISNDIPGQSGHGFGVHIFPDGSLLNVELHTAGNAYQTFRNVPGVSFTSGEWVHIAVVYTPGNVKTYVNGSLKDSHNYVQQPLDGADIVRIGRHNDTNDYPTSNFFKGAIDELSVYHVALSETQIAAIAGVGGTGKTRHDAGRQFNGTAPQQAGDLWTYGSINFSGIDTSTFVLNTNLVHAPSGIIAWESPGGGQVAVNPTEDVIIEESGHVFTQPHQVRQFPDFPGTHTRPSVLRWTAPEDGRYAVCGSFIGVDDRTPATFVAVYHNDEQMTQVNGESAVGFVNDFQGTYVGEDDSFTGIIFAEAGDTVDFIVSSYWDARAADSTGTFASVVPLGGVLPPVSNLAIETEDPPETERLWQFQTTYAGAAPGLDLRLQYAEAGTPNTWHDLDVFEGSNSFTRTEGTDTWLLQAALNVPTGNYRFRVTAAATGYLDVTGVVFGQNALGGETDAPIPVSAPGEPPPPPPPLQMAAASKLAYSLGGKTNAKIVRQGAVATFTITQPTPPGTPEPQVTIQWSTTPNDEASWKKLRLQTVSGPTSVKRTQRSFKVTSRNLPGGEGIYFRVLTTDKDEECLPAAGPMVKGALKLIGPITVTPGPVWEYISVAVTSNNPGDNSGSVINVGQQLTYTLAFANEGEAPANNIEARMKLPQGTVLTGGTSEDLITQIPDEKTRLKTRELVWKIPSLAPEETVTKQLTVEVVSYDLAKITFKKAMARVKSLEIKKFASATTLFGYPHNSKTLDSIIPSKLELYLSADNKNPRVGDLVKFQMQARNKLATPITDAQVTFKVPSGMYVEYVELKDSFGNFADGPSSANYAPTMGTNPSLTPYVYGGRQTLTWNLDTVPGETTRNIRFALRVVHDLAATRDSSNGPVPNLLFADDYNFSAKVGGKTRQAYAAGKVPSLEFELSPNPMPTGPPNLQLDKTAAADGAPAPGGLPTPAEPLYVTEMAGIGRVAAPFKHTRMTYRLKYSNKAFNNAPGDNRPSTAARNVIIHDEIPAGATFVGHLKKNGVPISAQYVNHRDSKGKIIPVTGDLTKTRFLDIFLGDYYQSLNPGEEGTITYDVFVTADEDTAIVSRAHGAKIPKPTNGGVAYEGYSIWCENRLFSGVTLQEKLTSKVVKPASFVLRSSIVKNPDPKPGEAVEIEIPYSVIGDAGMTLQNIAVTVSLPKPLSFDTNGCGQVNPNPAGPRGPDGLRLLRGYLGGESHTLASTAKDEVLTFNLGHLPGGRHGTLRVRVTLPASLPAAMLTKDGDVKELQAFVEMNGELVATPKAVALTRKTDLVLFRPFKGLAAAPAPAAAKSAAFSPQAAGANSETGKLFVGRVAPIKVKPSEVVRMLVFFGNASADWLRGGTVTMDIPEGLTFIGGSDCLFCYSPDRNLFVRDLPEGNLNQNLKTINGQKFISFSTGDIAPHTVCMLRLVFEVPSSAGQPPKIRRIYDNTLNASTSQTGGTFAPPMSIQVTIPGFADAPQLVAIPLEFLNGFTNEMTPAAKQLLSAQSTTYYTAASRQIGIAHADFLQLTNGCIIVPLGADHSLAIGPSGLVDAAQGNRLDDDGTTRIAVAHKNHAGFQLREVKFKGKPPQTFKVDDLVKGVVENTSLNLVAAGGGNMVAAGGGNMVAAGGLNLISNSTGLIGRAASTLIGNDGSTLIGNDGSTMVAAGGGNLVAAGGGNMVAAGAGNLVGNDGASLAVLNGSPLVAAGGGNMVAAGGLNMVAAGGGNMVAAGGGNFSAAQFSTVLNGGKLVGQDSGTISLAPPNITGAGLAVGAAGIANTINAKIAIGLVTDNGAGILSRSGSVLISKSQ